jgi:hypothetical protein
MSVMRAILARFARLLVRLAGALDPGVAVTSYVAKAERMSALRRRYPGAPDHWLRLLARKGVVGEAVEAPHYQPEHELSAEIDLPSTSQHSPPTQPEWPSRGSSRQRVQFLEKATTRAPAQSLSRKAKRSRHGTLAELQPAGRGPKRMANLFGLYRGKHRGSVRFEEQPVRPRAELESTSKPQTRSAADDFPSYHDRAVADRPEIRFDDNIHGIERNVDSGSWPVRPSPDRGDPEWPPQRNPNPAHPSWPSAPAPRARVSPDFIQHDSRWPELPSVPEELLRMEDVLRDEASLRAEQIGGAWSE